MKIKKQYFIILALLFLGFGIFDSARADLGCQVRAGGCLASETAVFKMSDTTNAHAETATSTNYNSYVCCGGVAGIGNSCGAANKAVVLRLSAPTNAHVEKNDFSPQNYYNNVCLSASSPVSCTYEANSCSGGRVGLASISADTNAHVGDYNAYSTKVCCSVTPPPPCQDHNVWGYAWSENIGWLSMSCRNTMDLDKGVNYGVDIDPASGKFSGHAWAGGGEDVDGGLKPTIGWISFNRTDTGSPPGPPYLGGGFDYIAKVDLGTGEVSGWAMALSFGGGWDGWIKLRGTWPNPVWIDSAGDFHDWAWGSDVVGWISFNCAEGGYNEVTGEHYSVCGTSDYKVMTSLSFNQPPNKPNVGDETWNNCAWGGSPQVVDGGSVTFNWSYLVPADPDGDPIEGYEIWVDQSAGFSAPYFNHVVNIGATSYVLDLLRDDDSDWITELEWNTIHNWQVRVTDDISDPAHWSEWSNSDVFKTPEHASPWPDFNWSPPEPTIGEAVVFDPDLSEAFGEASISDYLWTITQGTGVYVNDTDNTSREPNVVFSTTDNKMKLQVTDSDNLSCESSEESITAELPLPEYKEIPPLSRIKNFLAAVLTNLGKFAILF